MGNWERVVFRAGDSEFRWSDVAADARRSGSWAVLEQQTATNIAALRGAEHAGGLPSPEQTREAEAAFRYERRLVAGDDLRAWLAGRQIKVAEWRKWVRADLCRRLAAAPPDPGEVAADEIAEGLWVTGWCSGLLPQLARACAGRVAARRHMADAGSELPADEAFDRFCVEVATEPALENAVASNQLEWIMVECDVMSFADEDAAREGLACLRDDGLSIDHLVTMGTVVTRTRAAVGDFPPENRQAFLSAQEGDSLGPMTFDDGFAIAVVRGKTLPSAKDDAVRRRAEALVVARAVEREVEERVSWLEPL